MIYFSLFSKTYLNTIARYFGVPPAKSAHTLQVQLEPLGAVIGQVAALLNHSSLEVNHQCGKSLGQLGESSPSVASIDF